MQTEGNSRKDYSRREMKIETVAIYAKGDEDSLHVSLADQAICIGEANPLDSYLNIERIISAAEITGANAIHLVTVSYLNQLLLLKLLKKMISTSLALIKDNGNDGDKITARQTVHAANVPVIPGSDGEVESVDEIKNSRKK